MIFWPVYVLVFFALTLLAIPKKEYKKYLIYGLIFGGLIEVAALLLLGNLLGFFSYYADVFLVLGIPSLLPLAFMFAWMIFFYYLPTRKGFSLLYMAAWVGMSFLLGALFENFGLITYHTPPLPSLLIQLAWFVPWTYGSAWYFMRDTQRNGNQV